MPQTVLILDDEPDIVLLITETLRRQLPEVQTAGFSSAGDALAWCATGEPELCLVDYRMPGMSGVEFISAVRRYAHFQAVPVIMITAQPEPHVRHEALAVGATDFLAKPIDPADVAMRVRNHLRLHAGWRARRTEIIGLERQLEDAAQRAVEREQQTIIQQLVRLSGYRDEETASHMMRMATTSGLVAEELGMDHGYCEQLRLAAPMHDIGKVGVSDRILLKPGRLDAVEREIMQGHTRIGHDLLKGSASALMQLGAQIAHSHHEKWNGEGYPDRQAGEAIPLAGRIVAVADVFDALINARHYKPAWPVGDVVEHLRRERGRHFDPACVNALLRRLADVLDIQRQYAEPARDPRAPSRAAVADV
jgi:response regulator RpfG family c-di-GMP phosphodiesterase